MVEMLTDISPQPCRISIPEMVEKLTAMQDRMSRDA